MEASRIERLLPEVFRRCVREGTPLAALLSTMEALHAPAEETLREVDAYFNTYRAPERFLPLLARWVDLYRITEPRRAGAPGSEWRPPPLFVEPGNFRELIARAAHLSQWRGTAYGLKLFLETATGHAGFETQEQVTGPDGMPRLYHIKVVAPGQAESQRPLIERIIEQEKPAYVTYELEFAALEQGEDSEHEEDRGQA
jgi:P2-related tail formation protein